MPLGLQFGMKDVSVPNAQLRAWVHPGVLGVNGQGAMGMGIMMINMSSKWWNGGAWKVDSYAVPRTGMYWDTNVAKGSIAGTFGYQCSGGFRFQQKINDAAGKNAQQHDIVYEINDAHRLLISLKGATTASLMPDLQKWTASYKLRQPAFSGEVLFNGKISGSVDGVDAYVIGEPMGKSLALGAYGNFSDKGAPNWFDVCALAALPTPGGPTMLRAGTHIKGDFTPAKSLDLSVMPPVQEVAGKKCHFLARVQEGVQKMGGEVSRNFGLFAHVEEVLPELDMKLKIEADGACASTMGLAGIWVKGGSAKAKGSWIVNFSIENIFGKDGPKLGMRIVQGGTPPPL